LDIEALIARGLQILIALGGAYFIALWFVLVVWTFRDIESRSRSVVTQILSTLLVILFWIPGMALYWVLRPKETLDEAYQRSLEEEYLLQDLEELPLCPNCQHYVEDDFQLCPHCHTQLKDHCHNCDRLVDLRWALCPYCGEAQHHHHEHAEPEKVTSPGERWVDPEVIEKRLRDAEEKRIREETRALPAATATDQSVRELLGMPFRRIAGTGHDATEDAAAQATAETVTTAQSETATVTATEEPVTVAESAAESAAVSAAGAEPAETPAAESGEEPDTGVVKSNGSSVGPTKVPKRFKVG
jgi:RNA polymerase subunit RPABC4/transcription elongation factor Spt4